MVNECTIYADLFSKEPHYLPVSKALERIRTGRSRSRVEEIRKCIDKEKSNKLKQYLPSVCFSGKFVERKDEKIINHSGFIVLDFDNLTDVRETQTEIISNPYVYACWVSPSGNGLKALVRIADGTKHRSHFEALKEVFPAIDNSGANESRVCFESYDPEIYINEKAKVFTKTKSVVAEKEQQRVTDDNQVFDKILKWLANRGDAFVRGDRNNFIFKLASACCRFGIHEEDAANSIGNALNFSLNNFSDKEAYRTIKSAYRANASKYGTAEFQNDVLVEKIERKELQFDESFYDLNVKVKDVIYAEDVKEAALSLYDKGYEKIVGIGIQDIDDHFKFKSGEITLLTGIGNYGKSEFLKYLLVMRALIFDEKFALFTPESNPAEEFYHDVTEMIAGCDCTPSNEYRISRGEYDLIYDWVSKHFFFIYPKDASPTPDYIKQRFLELVIKENVNGVVIDPFNQLTNDYKSAGGNVAKYLEFILTDFKRFAELNKLFFVIVAHPTKLAKAQDGNYPCPDVFDINDGAMWNNKMDNILVYHRPFMQTAPEDPTCEFHSKKIKRQKIVGKRGFILFTYSRKMRRFLFDGKDCLQILINQKNMFQVKPVVTELEFEEAPF